MEFGTVDLTDWLTTIGALILGSAIAAGLVMYRDYHVRKEANLREEANLRDEKLEKKNQQIAVFQTLWAYRSHADHSIFARFVAIDMVPMVFPGDFEIHECWNLYIDAVESLPFDDPAIENARWRTRNAGEKYQNLLKIIADQLGYNLTNDDLNRDYFPTANGVIFNELALAMMSEEEQKTHESVMMLLRQSDDS